MKKIYQYFNNIKTDTDSYSSEPLSQLEKKQWEKRIKKQLHHSDHKKRLLKVACIILCFIIPLAGIFKNNVAAAISSASDTISQWFTPGTDLSPYETIINTPLKSDGIKVTLESVLVDDQEIIVSTLQEYPEPIKNEGTWGYRASDFDTFKDLRKDVKKELNNVKTEWNDAPLLAAQLYVNNEKISGQLQIIRLDEDSESQAHILYSFDKIGKKLDVSDSLEIKMNFEEVTGKSNGKWKFAFKANASELASTSTIIPLDQKLTLPDGGSITLTEYKNNALGTYIYYTSQPHSQYNLQLRGKNDRGETIWFYDYPSPEGGRFKINNFNAVRANDIENMTLTLYTLKVSDYSDKDWNMADLKPYGEPFIVETKE